MTLFRETLRSVGAPRARCLFIHGLGEHSGRHLRTAVALSHEGIEVERFDWRGCGKSPGAPQWIERFSEYVDDAVAIATDLEGRTPKLPLFLHGHSAGGLIAFFAAVELGGRLAGLSVSAPAFETGDGASRAKIFIGKLLAPLVPRLKIPGTLDLRALARDPAVAKDYEADPLTCRFNTLRQGTELLAAMERLPSVAALVRVPTLLAHGGADRIIKVEGTRKLHEAVAAKDKALVVYPNAYHEIHNEPEATEYFAMLTEWILERAR